MPSIATRKLTATEFAEKWKMWQDREDNRLVGALVTNFDAPTLVQDAMENLEFENITIEPAGVFSKDITIQLTEPK